MPGRWEDRTGHDVAAEGDREAAVADDGEPAAEGRKALVARAAAWAWRLPSAGMTTPK